MGEALDRVRFALGPLAEYLAGLHLLTLHNSNEKAWREFLAQAESMPGAPDTIAGFLLAVRDCALAKGPDIKAPAWLADELSRYVTPQKPYMEVPAPTAPQSAPVLSASG